MSKVALIKCEEYRLEYLKNKLTEGLSFFGGLKSFIKKDDRNPIGR